MSEVNRKEERNEEDGRGGRTPQHHHQLFPTEDVPLVPGLETAPMWLEVGVVGGLGMIVYFGPSLYEAARNKVNVLWPRITAPVRKLWSNLEPLRRRRRNGSMIRVIAYLLPNYCFSPPPRIYIAGLKKPRAEFARGFITPGSSTDVLTAMDRIWDNNGITTSISSGTTQLGPGGNGEAEGEGILVAFELDDVESDFTDMEDRGDVESICPSSISDDGEEWDDAPDDIPVFKPGANSTRYKCSTPKPSKSKAVKLPDLCSQNNSVTSSAMIMTTINMETTGTGSQCGGNERNEIADLRGIIQNLTIKVQELISHNIDMTMKQNRTLHPDLDDDPLPPPPPSLLSNGEGLRPPPPPPPLPPPPPPMPSVSQIVQERKMKTNTNSVATPERTQAVVISATELQASLRKLRPAGERLREVPANSPVPVRNLRPAPPRSSTLTPQKNFPPVELLEVLKKRYEAMTSDDDDKENENDVNENDSSIWSSTTIGSERKSNSNLLKSRNANANIQGETEPSDKGKTTLPSVGPLKSRNHSPAPKSNSKAV